MAAQRSTSCSGASHNQTGWPSALQTNAKYCACEGRCPHRANWSVCGQSGLRLVKQQAKITVGSRQTQPRRQTTSVIGHPLPCTACATPCCLHVLLQQTRPANRQVLCAWIWHQHARLQACQPSCCACGQPGLMLNAWTTNPCGKQQCTSWHALTLL